MERMTIRLPESVKSWLEGRATKNSRSMNVEVVAIFKDIKEKESEEGEEPEQPKP